MKYFYICVLIVLAACAPVTIPSSVSSSTPTATANVTQSAAPLPTQTMLATRIAPATGEPTRAQTLAPLALNYEKSARAILLEADTFNATQIPRDAHVPMFRLYGDGTLIVAGEPAPLTTGLDASVRVGHLNDSQIQNLLNEVNATGFFNLQDYNEPRTKTLDAATATISIYLARAKTVRVYAPDDSGSPKAFADAYALIQRAIPADAQAFTPSDAYLSATLAGSASEISSASYGEWKASLRLADVTDGVTITGNNFNTLASLVGKNYPSTLFRDGERVYRVRFAPNLPRPAHLTDWVGTILNAPREFDGRAFDIVGYFRGWNVYGEARGNPPVSRSDWVIADASGAMYVTGAPPRGLDPASHVDSWTVIRLRATVNYVRLGTSHLELRRVDVVPNEVIVAAPTSNPTLVALPFATSTLMTASTPSPIPFTPTPTATRAPTLTPTPTATRAPTFTPTATRIVPTRTPTLNITTSDAAIALVKKNFPEVANIKPKSTSATGAMTDIQIILPRVDAWLIVFWEGWGDCPAGCVNQRYTYFAVERDGRTTKVGEYSRIYNAEKNAFEEKGSPLWGVP